LFNNGHWIGKIIGFVIGLAKGGLAGAIFGGFLGHLFDQWRAGLSQARDIQKAFFSNLFATLGHLAKADGHVSQHEINQVDMLMQRMHLAGEDRKEAIRQFNHGKSSEYNFAKEIRAFAQLTITRPDLRHMFFEILLQAAAADGKLTPAELQILRVVIKELRLPLELLDELLAWFRSGRQGSGPNYQAGSSTSTPDLDYSILGINSKASDSEVKRAYRKLMSKYHPDKLIHQGLPESAMDIAREKTRAINTAYDRIKARRGFK